MFPRLRVAYARRRSCAAVSAGVHGRPAAALTIALDSECGSRGGRWRQERATSPQAAPAAGWPWPRQSQEVVEHQVVAFTIGASRCQKVSLEVEGRPSNPKARAVRPQLRYHARRQAARVWQLEYWVFISTTGSNPYWPSHSQSMQFSRGGNVHTPCAQACPLAHLVQWLGRAVRGGTLCAGLRLPRVVRPRARPGTAKSNTGM